MRIYHVSVNKCRTVAELHYVTRPQFPRPPRAGELECMQRVRRSSAPGDFTLSHAASIYDLELN